MKKFIQSLFLFSIPIIVVVGAFIYMDLFEVIWHYDNYYSTNNYVGVNRGYVTTMVYKHNKDKYKFDSFIFGNSRSLAYIGAEWKDFLPNSSVCYHYDESSGSVSGVYHKIKFINDHDGELKNALLVIDPELLSNYDLDGHLFIIPPQIVDYKNVITFYKEHLLAFTNLRFLRAYIDYRISKKYKKYMGSFIHEYVNSENKGDHSHNYIDPINNDAYRFEQDSLIRIGKYYTEERTAVFKNMQHPDSIYPAFIDEKRAKLLQQIKTLFNKHNTNYRIVISPLYNQIQINPKDLQFLNRTFGKENVFNFSGKNKWNLDYHNYYEQSHYRPTVANEVMKIIYGRIDSIKDRSQLYKSTRKAQ